MQTCQIQFSDDSVWFKDLKQENILKAAFWALRIDDWFTKKVRVIKRFFDVQWCKKYRVLET